ncbi:hypothetical protein [Ulvibacter sp. MAR_2010_11]|uniref:hypothetical protein n=1 Tax=Ulvibacter sp. MAR_2010_11 TaxID=1250229 RepID=UPI001E3AAE8C|nr:hypothetical protein [Ulvibacter sp. MAR_2010_11]
MEKVNMPSALKVIFETMSFFDLSKLARVQKVAEIQFQLQEAVKTKYVTIFIDYFSNEDTYIR